MSSGQFAAASDIDHVESCCYSYGKLSILLSSYHLSLLLTVESCHYSCGALMLLLYCIKQFSQENCCFSFVESFCYSWESCCYSWESCCYSVSYGELLLLLWIVAATPVENCYPCGELLLFLCRATATPLENCCYFVESCCYSCAEVVFALFSCFCARKRKAKKSTGARRKTSAKKRKC